ncbi:hypothetical protein V5O48_000892 [Marasmius crinis-equi]|uniref:S-adenosyl-L-methionine-dependent methyltransferase n=1 Tax=Marasmius crinis-equi TaxID=585013 RepID=A0ABR3G0J7_9AGAR
MSDASLYDSNIAHWDHFAKDLDKQPWGIASMKLWRKLLPHVLKAAPFDKDTSEVMDFGCGNGFNASLLVPHAKSILGVDVSSGMVDEFNSNIQKWGLADEGKISAVRVDLTEGGLDNKKFDIIFSTMVYHHLPSVDETTKILASFLKPGGRLLIIDWIKGQDKQQYSEQIDRIMKVDGFDEEEMKATFERAGLESLGFEPAAKINEMVGDYYLDKTAYLAWGGRK